MRRLRKTGKVILIALFWLGLWTLLAQLVHLDLLLPSPLTVARRFVQLVQEPVFWRATLATLLRILSGFFIGMLSGLLLAVLMHISRVARSLLAPLVQLIRATPVASFIILALVWLSSSRLPVFICSLMVLPVAISNTEAGIRSVDRQLLEMAQVYHLRRVTVLRHIYWPALKPYLLAAAGSAMGLAWKSGVTAEVIAAPRFAIGSKLNTAKVYLETPDVFVWTIVVVLLSLLLEKALRRAVKEAK